MPMLRVKLGGGVRVDPEGCPGLQDSIAMMTK
jgi:hypothetical protein